MLAAEQCRAIYKICRRLRISDSGFFKNNPQFFCGKEVKLVIQTQAEVLQIAMEQSAIDLNCQVQDLLSDQNVVVASRPDPKARKYLKLPFLCNFVSYGGNIVASAGEGFEEIARRYISTYPVEHCFETPNMLTLMEQIKPMDANVCFMAEYWLPDLARMSPKPCDFELKMLKDFDGLYLPQWRNALCSDRRELDVLGVGAYRHGQLVGLAACSADCDTMYQIGVDVLPEYRRQGIASAVTSALALEVLRLGKVPFYCCAWSNVNSAGNAVKSGFSPAWVEMTVKENSFIQRMNGQGAEV